MRIHRLLALVLALGLVAAACSSDDTDTAATGDDASGTDDPTPEPTDDPTPEPTDDPTPEPTADPTPEPTDDPTPEPAAEGDPEGFVITAVEFGDEGFIELRNTSAGAASPDGLWICQFPTYNQINVGDVAAGETVRIPASAVGGLSAEDGEVGLYLNGDFASSSAIISYVEWGSTGHQRASVAAGAGIWDREAAPGGGAGITTTTDVPTTAADWTAS